jgi:anti-repressor protein
MNNLMIFEHDQFGKVRIHVDGSGDPWWIASEVCGVLGIGNTSDVVKTLDDDEKMTIDSIEGHSGQRGGAQFYSLVNEPGLYSLVLRSRKPEAKAFKRWLTHEVIPSIRKHGGYLIPSKIEELLVNPDLIIAFATELKNERVKAAQQLLVIEAQAQKIEEDAPKVEFVNMIAAEQLDIEIGELNVILTQNGVPIGRNKLFAYLRNSGWLVSQPGERYNLPTQKGAESGYFKETIRQRHHKDSSLIFDGNNNPVVDRVTLVTPKGQAYFCNLLKKELTKKRQRQSRLL